MKRMTIAAGVTSIVCALAFSASAQTDFVKTVSSEGQCVAQDGTVMDLQGAKHCLVPVIPAEFQKVEYAGEIKGVTECDKKDTRETKIGDFCFVALEKKKTAIVNDLMTQEKNDAKVKAKDSMN